MSLCNSELSSLTTILAESPPNVCVCDTPPKATHSDVMDLIFVRWDQDRMVEMVVVAFHCHACTPVRVRQRPAHHHSCRLLSLSRCVRRCHGPIIALVNTVQNMLCTHLRFFIPAIEQPRRSITFPQFYTNKGKFPFSISPPHITSIKWRRTSGAGSIPA